MLKEDRIFFLFVMLVSLCAVSILNSVGVENCKRNKQFFITVKACLLDFFKAIEVVYGDNRISDTETNRVTVH